MLSPVVLVLLVEGTSAVGYYSYGQPDRSPPEWPNLLSMDDLALRGGYHLTNYEVITEDGYSLWLHRIGNNTGPPVLMQHGFGVAAEQWISRPNSDLAFLLLKDGYDVWLSNLRGTVFNEYSLKYPKSDQRFWDFSLQENGMYDLPAFIDTVLDVRKLDSLFYIGHSQGTTVFMVMCSTRPEYNKKIRAAILLSPVAYTPAVKEQAPAIRILTTKAELINKVFRSLGIYYFGIRTEQTINFLRETCVNNSVTRVLCLDVLGILAGEDRKNLNLNEWYFFVPYYGAGSSLYVGLHLAQLYLSGEFKQLDLGPLRNFKRYGSVTPPSYDLKRVTAPTFLFWGYNDFLTSESSVMRMASDLQNVLLVKAVPDPKFNHVDMYIANNAPYILYPDIIRIMNSIVPYKSPSRIKKELEASNPNLKLKPLGFHIKKFAGKEQDELLFLGERLKELYSKHNYSTNILKELF